MQERGAVGETTILLAPLHPVAVSDLRFGLGQLLTGQFRMQETFAHAAFRRLVLLIDRSG